MARQNKTRDDWLKAALTVFEHEGEAAVQITRLARLLGVARSGFYWHFAHREELLEALVDFWDREYTTSVIRLMRAEDLPPRERLLAIADRVVENEFNRLDASMLAWARRDPKVAKQITKTYRARERFVGAAFEELGFKGEELKARTRAFVAAVSAEHLMFASASKRDARAVAKVVGELLTRR